MKLQRGLKFQETGVARAREVGFSLSLEPRFLLNFPFSLFPHPSLNKSAFCGWLLAVPFAYSLGRACFRLKSV